MPRIILADDDPLFADVVCNILISVGYAVGHCLDGQQALAAIRFRPPHLLILDCNMPVVTGIDVLRTMRRSPELFQIPVLMLTARTSDNDERIARFDGAHDYISKPVHPEELLIRIRTLLKTPDKGFYFNNLQPKDRLPQMRRL